LQGRCTILVNVPPSEGNISVAVGDILTNNQHGAGTGADLRIGTLVDVSKIRTLNDLLSMNLPERFVSIPLEKDYELSRAGDLGSAGAPGGGWRIPGQFAANVAPARKLMLEPVRDARRDGGGTPGIHVIAGESFRIGRQRGEVDFVAWFWPRSTENDEKTKKISRSAHAVLRRDGGRVLVEDPESMAGSTFEGERVRHSAATPSSHASEAGAGETVLSQRGVLILAHEYQIDIVPFVTTFEGPLAIINERLWPGPTPPLREFLWAAVRFEPLNSEVALHHAVWIFTDATFGCSRSNAIVLDQPDVPEIQGRITYYRSQFWIETFAQVPTVCVNGGALKPGEIVPLVEGQEIRIGQKEYRVGLERQ
jgi:hypothetical protein